MLRQGRPARARVEYRKWRICRGEASPKSRLFFSYHAFMTRSGSAVETTTKLGVQTLPASGAPAAALICAKRVSTDDRSSAPHPAARKQIGVLQRAGDSSSENPVF